MGALPRVRLATDYGEEAGAERVGMRGGSRRSRSVGSASFFAHTDGRTLEARRWRDLYEDAMARSGGLQEERCRTLATLILRKELLEGDLVSGRNVDPEILVKLSGEIRRISVALGLTPRGKQVTRAGRRHLDPATDRIVAAIRGED
jgi:hypothetical protein